MSPQFYSHVYQSYSLGFLYPWALSLVVADTDTAAQGNEGANFTICPFPIYAVLFAVERVLLPQPHLTAGVA